MRQFTTARVAGWCHASDTDTASLLDRVIADLERQALRCERATSRLENAAITHWDISDRH